MSSHLKAILKQDIDFYESHLYDYVSYEGYVRGSDEVAPTLSRPPTREELNDRLAWIAHLRGHLSERK
jgi:hypothetical protein